jgi:hypothetical protein
MVLTFHYKEVKIPNGPTRKRPIIPVTFSNGDESFEILGLLDSGADLTAFTQEIAEVLGLDLSGKPEPCIVAGGNTIDSIQSKVRLSIGKGHEHYHLMIPVKVLMIKNGTTPPLLGRMGFFSEFKITFDEMNEKIQLVKTGIVNRHTKVPRR